ncbi:MAG: response regulator [Planctomycetes bacterium]|jgi:CheY-like chemotaxis protein/PAS domain-containing protein|nr:response regulator [Planctomycetota bacterium]
MSEQTALRKLLVLHGPVLAAQGVVEFLQQHFEVSVAAELADALDAMRQTQFDAVLAETADFLPLERGAVTHQAAVVLDTIGDGVCIIGPGGELVWANRRARELPSETRQSLKTLCMSVFEEFSEMKNCAALRGKRFSMMPQDGAYFEVLCSPVCDRQGVLRQVAAVVVNATVQRRQELKLNAIDRAGRELVRLDYEALSNRDAVQRLALLEERIIRCSKDVLSYQHFAVLLLDKRTNRLELVISEGLDEDPRKYELFARTDGNGICGYVAATGRSYICHDVRTDQRYIPGLRNARSSLTVPLRLHDKVVGVLNVESDGLRSFGEEDRQFAEIFGNYVALALHILNLLTFERHSTHTQVSGSISAELNGPINDIISDASELMEDYIGHDRLRSRLGSIIEQATQVRQAIQKLAQSPTIIGALPAEPKRHDPVLVGKRILVADDEELIRQTVHDVLTPYGCQVDMAADGLQAIENISKFNYDLVITDIKMPGATGYQVFQSAKAKNSAAPIIMITAFGYDPNHSIVRANQQGLNSVLFKPFNVRRLLEECRTALTAKA